MPQPRSARFDAEQKVPHSPIGRVDILDGGGTLIQRNVPVLPGGQVTCDRNAANLLVREVQIPLEALTPEAVTALTSDVAATYIQTYRGIRYTDTDKRGGTRNTLVDNWTPINGGVMVGVTVNGSGELQLGP